MYQMTSVALWRQCVNWEGDGKLHVDYIPLIYHQQRTDETQSYFLGTKGRSKQNPVYHEKVKGGKYLVGEYQGSRIWPMGPIQYWAFSADEYGTVAIPMSPNAVKTNCWLRIGFFAARLRSDRRLMRVGPEIQLTINWTWDGYSLRRDDSSWENSSAYSGMQPFFRIAVSSVIRSLPLFMDEDTMKTVFSQTYLEGKMQGHLADLHHAMSMDIFYGNYSLGNTYSVVSPKIMPVVFQNFFHEDLRYQGYPIVDMSNYWIRYATQHAFLDACQSAPSLNDNSISNILEITGFIYKLVVKHQIDIPNSLQDAWLAYRYSYGTTKMDAEEAISFMSRHLPDNIWDIGYKAYGCHVFTYKGATVTARCTMRMKRKEVSKIRDIWIALEKYGLAPDFYVIWDMIPYSFIVDWFVPVGDVLDVIDASTQYTEENYDFGQIVYSLSYSFNADDGLPHHVYSRWVEETPPALSGYYWLEKDKTSNKTIVKRVLDTLSLFT
jgi:hypothetical protein